jgi:uncharacterized protein YjbJ (UPF0337 family)
MNDDILAGQWKQMKGSLKAWWGNLSDDDFNYIGGQKDKLIGWVQEKYGGTYDEAAGEVETRLKEYGAEHDLATAALTAKAYDVGETLVHKVSDAATAVRSGAGRANFYLQEKTFSSMGSDVMTLIRKHPVPSLLVGICVGMWLTRKSR